MEHGETEVKFVMITGTRDFVNRAKDFRLGGSPSGLGSRGGQSPPAVNEHNDHGSSGSLSRGT